MEMNFVLLLQFLAVACLVLVILSLLLIYLSGTPPNLKFFESEKFFLDPKNRNKKCAFPSLETEHSLYLSVVVPAYNEEERLPVMMDEMMEYLKLRQEKEVHFSYEVIVVDDGSKDKTTETGLQYSEKYGAEKVRVLTLAQNRGKGGAIRMGMLRSRGKFLLFADADGATKFSDLAKLESCMEKINSNRDELAIVCGSRAHLEKDSIAQRSMFRTFLMYGFHFLVWFLCVRGVKDTQCGFKLLTRNAARLIFTNMHVDRWAFDVDLLHIAQHYRVPVGEVAVTWEEIEGSKVTPFWSWLEMGRDLVLIRLRYLIGAWRMDHHLKSQ